jgi:hypothetical protein
MPQRLLHKAQTLKCSQRGCHSTISLNFSQITQTSHRGEGKRSQRLKEEYFCWWKQHRPKKGGGKFLYYPPKTSRWKLASRNRNNHFLKYSRYRPNRTLWLGNQNIRFFQGLVRGGVYEAIMFHSSHLGF